jgi:hypothetical protein
MQIEVVVYGEAIFLALSSPISLNYQPVWGIRIWKEDWRY